MEEHAEGGPKPRIESLSDLVFGLALGIGAISLVNNPPVTVHGMYTDIAIFGFNFLIIISIWLRYTRIMSVLPIETRWTMLLNTGLLFTVILEPFIYNILRSPNSANPSGPSLFEAASSLFGLDLGVMMLVMGVFTFVLADEEKHLVAPRLVRQFRVEGATWFLSSAIFLASALPFFGKFDLSGVVTTGFTIRQVTWLSAIFIAWATRALERGFRRP